MEILKETVASLFDNYQGNVSVNCTFSNPIFPSDGQNDFALILKTVAIKHDGFKASYQACHFLWFEGSELKQKLVRGSQEREREIKEVIFEINRTTGSCSIHMEYPYNGPCGIGGFSIATSLRHLKEGD